MCMSSPTIPNHGSSSTHIDSDPGIQLGNGRSSMRGRGDVEMGALENPTEELAAAPVLRNTRSLRLRRQPTPPPSRTPSWPRSSAPRPTRAPPPPPPLPPPPTTPISNSPVVADQPGFWTFLCNFFTFFIKFLPGVKINLEIQITTTGPSSGRHDDQPIFVPVADQLMQGSSNERPVEVIIHRELDQSVSNTEAPTRPALEASSPTRDVSGEEHQMRVIKEAGSLIVPPLTSVVGIGAQLMLMADQNVTLEHKILLNLLLVTTLAALFLGLVPLICGSMLRDDPRRLCMMKVAFGVSFLDLALTLVIAYILKAH